MKIIKIIFFFILISVTQVSTQEFRPLVTINNRIITNYDLLLEIKTLEFLNDVKINDKQQPIILQQMINEKIKEIELKNYKLSVSDTLISKKLNLSLQKKNKLITKDIKDNIKNKIILQDKWNRLINLKYSQQLYVNTDEINQIIKSKNLKEKDREKIISIEKNKKLNIYSKTFFNQIKVKYLIKYL